MEYDRKNQTITQKGRLIYTGTNGFDRRIACATITLGLVYKCDLCKGVRDGFLERAVPYVRGLHSLIVGFIDDGKIGLRLRIKSIESVTNDELFVGGKKGLNPVMGVLTKLGTCLERVNEESLNTGVIAYQLDEKILGIEFLS